MRFFWTHHLYEVCFEEFVHGYVTYQFNLWNYDNVVNYSLAVTSHTSPCSHAGLRAGRRAVRSVAVSRRALCCGHPHCVHCTLASACKYAQRCVVFFHVGAPALTCWMPSDAFDAFCVFTCSFDLALQLRASWRKIFGARRRRRWARVIICRNGTGDVCVDQGGR